MKPAAERMGTKHAKHSAQDRLCDWADWTYTRFCTSPSDDFNDNGAQRLIYLNVLSPGRWNCLGRIKRCGLVGGCITRARL